MAATDTKQRIVDVAERLFTEKGYTATWRDITSAARVNLAAMHYHFGPTVFERRLTPIDRERLEELTRFLQKQYSEVLRRFEAPVQRTLPHIPHEELGWWIHLCWRCGLYYGGHGCPQIHYDVRGRRPYRCKGDHESFAAICDIRIVCTACEKGRRRGCLNRLSEPQWR